MEIGSLTGNLAISNTVSNLEPRLSRFMIYANHEHDEKSFVDHASVEYNIRIVLVNHEQSARAAK